MGKVVRAVAAVALIAACAACSTTLNAPARDVVLDGDLADWAGVDFVTVTPQTGTFDGESPSTDDPADLSYRFGVCRDAEALYVAVEVTWRKSELPLGFAASLARQQLSRILSAAAE